MTYVWFGCAGNVFTTCNGRDQVKRARAYARRWVYMSDNARRDIGGARWDLGTDGVLCWSAGRKELNFTCWMRTVWAGRSRCRQELFQVTCDDLEFSWTSISYYGTCMKCRWSYLVPGRSAAVVACYIFECPKGEVILLWWRSNMEWSKLFSCVNCLSEHDIQLAINLSRDILAGVS